MPARDEHYYEPARGHGLPHDPFNAIVGPRPIGWISSRSPQGVLNLAPYSFFNAFNYHPPIVGFSSTAWKDSVANIQAAGEFGWSLATRDLAERMNRTSQMVGPEVDEFALAGLTPEPSRLIGVPRVGEARVSFECRLSQLVQLQGADGGKIESWMVFGEVVAVHIDRSLLKDGIYQTAQAHPILRAGGPSAYAEVGPEAIFHMDRPDKQFG